MFYFSSFHSKLTFKIIQVHRLCYNRKSTYYFLLVITCHPCSISHRLRELDRKPPHPSLNPRSRGPFSNFVIKLGRQRVKSLGYIFVKTAHPNFRRFVAIHSRHRETDNILYQWRNLQCNCNVPPKP